MKWQSPLSLLQFLRYLIAFNVLDFFLRWAGHGNLPGPDPRGWGDPIPLDRAARQVPGAFVVSLLVGGLFALISGIRSSATDNTLPIPPANDVRRETVACPMCAALIDVRESSGVFQCESCHENMHFTLPSPAILTIALIAGFVIALASGWDGGAFVWLMIVTTCSAESWITFFRRPRIQLDMPSEFHQALPGGGAH